MYINGEYVKGTIYFDKSFKDMYFGRVRNHNEYRADVVYNDRRHRFRSKNYEDCVNFLLGLKEEHKSEYIKKCEWCGVEFECGRNAMARYCSANCRNRRAAQKQRKSFGYNMFDPATISESGAHLFYGMGKDTTKQPKAPAKPIDKKALVSKGKMRKLRRKGIDLRLFGVENDDSKKTDSKSSKSGLHASRN